jgi:integrase
MKPGKEHRVPLSRQAVELLRALPREERFVFIGAKAGVSKNAMQRVLKRLRADGATVHGLLSAFRNWAAERTSFPAAVSLTHVVGNAVARAYHRTDLLEQRRRLLQQWSDFCDSPVGTAEVTPLRRRARS